MSKLLLTLIACASCDGVPEITAVPWLRGFSAASASDVGNPVVAQRMADLDGDRDSSGYGGIQLVADVAESEGTETVLASYRDGVVVLDRSGRVLGHSPGFDATGSSDELIALAAGDGLLGVPMLALAVSFGGHRESSTSIVLYRVGPGGDIGRIFMAPVEEHDGDQTLTGSITLLPDALVYRAPGASTATLWMFDAKRGRYVELRLVRPLPRDDAPSRDVGNLTSSRA